MHLGNYAIESWFSLRFAQALVAVVVAVDDGHGLSRSICLKHFAVCSFTMRKCLGDPQALYFRFNASAIYVPICTAISHYLVITPV